MYKNDKYVSYCFHQSPLGVLKIETLEKEIIYSL